MEPRHMPKLINGVTIRYIIMFMVVIVFMILVFSSCQPTVIETPVTTTMNNVSIEQIVDSPDLYRLYDHQERKLCYVLWYGAGGSAGGVFCFELEE